MNLTKPALCPVCGEHAIISVTRTVDQARLSFRLVCPNGHQPGHDQLARMWAARPSASIRR